MPCSRSAASLARRSAIRWFSSAGGGVAGVWSVMDEIVCRRSGLRPRRPFVGRGYAPDAGNYGTAMRPLAVVAVRRGRSPDLRGLYRVGALRARLEPRLQARLDEFVQVTVENFLRIRALDAGAQVLDAALVEHVVADLAAPADVGLVRFGRVAPSSGCYAAAARFVPAARLAVRPASTKSSRSPSRTFCVSERVRPVRRSLMRLWSCT